MKNNILKNKNAYDKWANSYDDWNNPHILLEHKWVLKIVNPQKNDYILDAWCWTWKYTTEFYNLGSEVIWIDISEKMIDKAKIKNNKINYNIVNISDKLPFSDNSFNKINCSQVLKHINNLEFAISEFYRILKKWWELTFSVTHPDRPKKSYKLKEKSSFNLAEESNIFHHTFFDYFKSFEKAWFEIKKIKQIVLNDDAKDIIELKDFNEMKWRPEIIIFNLKK